MDRASEQFRKQEAIGALQAILMLNNPKVMQRVDGTRVQTVGQLRDVLAAKGHHYTTAFNGIRLVIDHCKLFGEPGIEDYSLDQLSKKLKGFSRGLGGSLGVGPGDNP